MSKTIFAADACAVGVRRLCPVPHLKTFEKVFRAFKTSRRITRHGGLFTDLFKTFGIYNFYTGELWELVCAALPFARISFKFL